MYQFTCNYKLYGKRCCKSVTSNLSDLCDRFVLLVLNFITDKYYTMRHSQKQVVETSYTEFQRMKNF